MIEPWNTDTGLLAVVLIGVCAALLLFRNKIRKQEAQLLRKILDNLKTSPKEEQTQHILFLDGESPSYSVLDQILSQPSCIKLVVVLWAPAWLARAKSASWVSHQVIHPDQCSECRRFYHKGGHIYVLHHGRVKEEVKESVQFLQDVQYHSY